MHTNLAVIYKVDLRKLFFLLLVFISMTGHSVGQEYPKVILKGDFPDPSIIREGEDYYMTNSPFYYAPGFLIWHSKDLLNWEPVCRAITEYKGSAMAPDLVKYNGKYYIYYPAAGTNWVIWSDNIRGPWSKPIDLKVEGIDPGHVADEKGNRYLYLNNGEVIQLTEDGLATLNKKKKVYDGWVYPKSWVTECMCLESPKLNYFNGYYYLTSAEGGTAGPATSHMVVAARSKSVLGPWENSPYNPIVHTYSAEDSWWSKGHGTLIDDVNGNWWIVYHAYENGYHTLGRQTLIEPIEWTSDGWFRIKASNPPLKSKTTLKHGLELSDDFKENTLGLQWTFWKEYAPQALTFKRQSLFIQAKGKTPADGRLLLTTAMDKNYETQVKVTTGKYTSAGLILYYNEKAYAGIISNGTKFTIYKNAKDSSIVSNKIGKNFFVKLQNQENNLNISVSKDGKTWISMIDNVDVSGLHHNKFGGFYALRIGLIAAGNGVAKFNNFIYHSRPDTEESDNPNSKNGVLAPKPVFRDPVYDGAADPVVIWNPLVSKWWMFYTNRRATMTELPGVSWVFGTPIGIAESSDGANWKYLGTANFNDLPAECGGKDSVTLWAPDIVLGDDGKWHMYLSIVPGIDVKWGLPGFIAHLSSTNLRDWKYESRLSQLGTRVIDADILRMPDGIWRMYYKDQTGYSHINVTESKDLYFWSTPKEALKIRGEGPIAFQWKGYYWLIVDTWNGQTVHRSKDGNTWQVQPGRPLMPDGEGTGKDDIPNALHANVVISSNRVYMYYFTHPGRIGVDKNKDSYEQRRTSIQVVELKLNEAGWLTANRNEPTYVKLSNL